jgi:hypothetical protein
MVNPGTSSLHRIKQMYARIVDPSHEWTCLDGHAATDTLRHKPMVVFDTTRLRTLWPALTTVEDSIEQGLTRLAARPTP